MLLSKSSRVPGLVLSSGSCLCGVLYVPSKVTCFFFLEPPASSHIPKHSGRRIGYAKLPLGLNKNVNVHTMDPMQDDDPHPIHGVMDPIQGELCYPLLCSHNDPSQDTMLTNEDPTRQSNPGCCVDCHCISELGAYGTCLAPRSKVELVS